MMQSTEHFHLHGRKYTLHHVFDRNSLRRNEITTWQQDVNVSCLIKKLMCVVKSMTC